MNYPANTCALFIASMVLTCSAYAGTDINKCVAPSGAVTITDEACPSGADAVTIVSAAPEAGVAPTQAIVVPQRVTLARMPPRYAALMRTSRPARGLALDVATLRTARQNLHLLDNAADLMRSQRVASLH